MHSVPEFSVRVRLYGTAVHVRVRLYSVAEFVQQYSVAEFASAMVRLRIQIQLYCTFAFPVQFSLLSWQGFGQQDQIRSAASDPVEF